MRYKALDDDGASRGWSPGKHPSSELQSVVAEDLAINVSEVINVGRHFDLGKCGLCQHVIEQVRTACCYCYTTRRYFLL